MEQKKGIVFALMVCVLLVSLAATAVAYPVQNKITSNVGTFCTDVYKCTDSSCTAITTFIAHVCGTSNVYTMTGTGVQYFAEYDTKDCYMSKAFTVDTHPDTGAGPWAYKVDFRKGVDCRAPIDTMTIAPTSLTIGQEEVVTARIESAFIFMETGPQVAPDSLIVPYFASKVDVLFYVNGALVDSKQVDIATDEATYVSFHYTPASYGSYNFTIKTRLDHECKCDSMLEQSKSIIKIIEPPAPQCGDGVVNATEQCELPSTQNNQFCGQSTTACQGTKLGTRDAFGNCNVNCGCTQDSFSYQCVKGQCGATCVVNADCNDGNPHTTDTCDVSSCACTHTRQDYCGDGVVNVNIGEQCELPNTNNNPYCSQSTTGCQGAKQGTRDAFGSCGSSCGCVTDSFSYQCVRGACGAECSADRDCDSKCVGNTLYFGGSCDAAGNCGCSYVTLNCGDLSGLYDSPCNNTRWVPGDGCGEREQKQKEYRDYSCSPDGCTYTISEIIWVDTGVNRPVPDGTTCDDGLFCTIRDRCTKGVCSGAQRDCSGYDIPGVSSCTLDPDGNPFTYDHIPGKLFACDEAHDICAPKPLCEMATGASATSENAPLSRAVFATGGPDAPTPGCNQWSGPGYAWTPQNWNIKSNLTLSFAQPVSGGDITIYGNYDSCWDRVWLKDSKTGASTQVFSGPNTQCTLTIPVPSGVTGDTVIVETCGWSWSAVDAVQLCGVQDDAATHVCSDNDLSDGFGSLACGAECDQDSDCPMTQCSDNNGCYDGTYRIYLNIMNSCTDGCSCTSNSCSLYIEDPSVGCECIDGETDSCGVSDVGECTLGVKTCTDGMWGSCSGAVYPVEEKCDGKDNDCDGSVDENGCECIPGATESCGQSDVGECAFGTKTCTSTGSWGACIGAIYPTAEVCDGKDNDCNGVIDDGFNFMADPNNCGGCGIVCGSGQTCVSGTCVIVDTCAEACKSSGYSSGYCAGPASGCQYGFHLFGDVSGCDTCCCAVQCSDPDKDGSANEGGDCGPKDNCPTTYNPDQRDSNHDGVGDACSEIDCSAARSVYPRRTMVIDQLSFVNEDIVKPGEELQVVVVVRNEDVCDLDNLRIKAAIPLLGVWSARLGPVHINSEHEGERDLFIEIPNDAKAGTYDLRLDVYDSVNGVYRIKHRPIMVD